MHPPVNLQMQRPTGAFIAVSWIALFAGAITFVFGLWNAKMALNEKGYYFTVLMYGLFSAVSLQKSVRDRLEGISVTGIYFGLCWFSIGLCIVLLAVGLWNANLALSEKKSTSPSGNSTCKCCAMLRAPRACCPR